MNVANEIVVTLITVQPEAIAKSLLLDVTDALKLVGAKELATVGRRKGQVYDIVFRGEGLEPFFDCLNQGRLTQLLVSRAVDFIVQPLRTRRKKLLFADMESTIIEQEMLDELAGLIGARDKVANITRRAMNGELDFASALRSRAQLLRGHPASLLEEAYKKITLMPGAVELLVGMKAAGAKTCLVSGGFIFFVKPIAERLGFDQYFANNLVIDKGVITGEITEPILDKAEKQRLLLQNCSDCNLTIADTLCVGDGANDIPMLAAAQEGGGLGIAYRAKSIVRSSIKNQINHGNLTALLDAQAINF